MKYTDEELVAMTKQYGLAKNGQYVSHIAYEEINRQGSEGRQWAKCANCGNPYPLSPEWGNDTICSQDCFDSYVAYLNDPREHLGSYGEDE